MTGEPFVPNDTQLDRENRQVAVITGPNMAGKSTYIGRLPCCRCSPTPAPSTGSAGACRSRRPHLHPHRREDDLSRGQSTIMVEMSRAIS